KIPTGVYTLRLGNQPQDGDHLDTAPHTEFAVLSPAAADKGVATMEVKALHEASIKITGTHPAVLLLFPGRDAGADPRLVEKGEGHWAVLLNLPITAGELKTTIGIALTLIGKAASA